MLRDAQPVRLQTLCGRLGFAHSVLGEFFGIFFLVFRRPLARLAHLLAHLFALPRVAANCGGSSAYTQHRKLPDSKKDSSNATR